MRLPDDPNKYTSRFKYVEVGRIIPNFKDTGKDKFIREQRWDNGQPEAILIPVDSIGDYANKFNNIGLYRSVYQYDSPDLTSAVPLGPLYFDLDSEDPIISFEDVKKLYSELKNHIPVEAIDVFFSGQKGFHIEVEPIVLGVSASDDLPKVSSFIAKKMEEQLELKTIDYQVYDVRRMWRITNSQHPKTGLFKVLCTDYLDKDFETILELAKQPRDIEIKPEQKFDPQSNKWYREFTYQYEQSFLPQESMENLYLRFLEQGTGYVRHFDKGSKRFDKFKLFKGCPAIRELETKAKTQNHLEHYERLFLCSLLTYTEESTRYLHEILEHCSDYNFEISNSHVEDWVKRREYGIGGRPFTCQKAKEVGIMCRGCARMEPKPKIINTGDGKYIESNELAQPSPIRHAYTIIKGAEIDA